MFIREGLNQATWRNRFRKRWQDWTRPSPTLTCPEARRQAQLTSSLILIILPFVLLHTASQITMGSDNDSLLALLADLLLPICMGALFYLSRTRYSRWAAAGIVFALASFPFFILFGRAEYSPLPVYNTLVWVLVAILVSHVLLPFRQAVGLVFVILIAILSFNWLLPEISFVDVFLRPFTLLAVMSALLSGFRRYTLSIEKEQRHREQQLYAELQASERQFRLLFEQAPIGMSISGPDGRLLHVNQAYCNTLGYTAAELQGLSFLQITHPDDHEANLALGRQLLAGEISSFFMEKRYLHKAGHTVYTLLQVVLERDAAGQPVHLIGQIVDITDRKKAEEERHENQQLLQGLIENSSALIFVKDLDGRYLMVNAPFEKAIQLPRTDILGHTDYELFSATIAAKIRKNDLAVLHTGAPLQFEESPTADPNGVTYLSTKFPLFGDAGRPYALAGISTDITHQKRTESLLRQQKTQLEALRQVELEITAQLDLNTLLQSIIAHSVEIVDGDRGALWLYQPAQDVLQLVAGYNGTLAVGTTLARGQDVIGAVWQSGAPMVVADYSEYPGRTPEFEGTLRNTSILGVPVFWRNEVQGAISIAKNRPGFFTDADAELLTLLAAQAAITLENARLHENIQRHSQELARSNQDLQDFAFAASHDLQEPLRKIQTFSDQLQARYAGQLDERGMDYLRRMQQAATRMQTLIVDLLAYSRVTTQARPFTTVNLNHVLTAVLNDLDMRIEETGAAVQVDTLPTIEADETQMEQLFLNLLSNALKFTTAGIPPVIHIQTSAITRTTCTITVGDNGIGFEEKYLDRIFGVFQRLHGRQEYSGTGVGLAICQKIVKRHSGTITATSAPHAGATFIITLPLRQPTTLVHY